MQETLVLFLGREDPLEKGYATQYSGMENSMDCIVQGVTKRLTQLSDFRFTSLPYSWLWIRRADCKVTRRFLTVWRLAPLLPLLIVQRSPVKVKVKSLSRVWVSHYGPHVSDPVDCSPPGSSVHGILQARVLEWVAISFSRESSWPRDWTQVSHIAGRRFNLWATRYSLNY